MNVQIFDSASNVMGTLFTVNDVTTFDSLKEQLSVAGFNTDWDAKTTIVKSAGNVEMSISDAVVPMPEEGNLILFLLPKQTKSGK